MACRIILRSLLLLSPAFLLTGCSLPSQFSSQGQAALQISATPQAEVFVNGKSIGQTPIDNKPLPAGTYTIAVKTITNQWVGKVTLLPSTETIINRDLSSAETGGSGEVAQVEAGSGIDIIGEPQNAAVILDQKQVGTTPLSLPNISAGDHEIVIDHEGYAKRKISVKVSPGYKTIFTIDLAKGNNQTLQSLLLNPSPTPTVLAATTTQATVNQYIGTSLQVHSEATTSASRVTQVNPGDVVQVLSGNDGWTQIQTQTGQKGWILSRFLIGQ